MKKAKSVPNIASCSACFSIKSICIYFNNWFIAKSTFNRFGIATSLKLATPRTYTFCNGGKLLYKLNLSDYSSIQRKL